MRLSHWIKEQGGTAKVGQLLDIKRNAVYAWLAGTAIPRPITMQKLVVKSKGKVTYDDIINEYKANLARRKEKRAAARPAKGAKKPKVKNPAPAKTPKTVAKPAKLKSSKPAKAAKKKKVDPGF